MQIAQVLSGYSLGEADLLRRAMGKKIKAEMDAQRDRFVAGAVDNGLTKAKADEIFDLLAKFADYGFNKSHAAAYALIAYQTAYLKANYPGRVSRRLDEPRQIEHRQAGRIQQRGAPARDQDPAALGATSGADFDAGGGRRRAGDPLRALGDQGRRRRRRRRRLSAAREARTARFATSAISPRSSIRATSTSACSKASPPPAAFDELEPDRARAFAAIETILAHAHRRDEERRAGQAALFGAEAADPLPLPKAEPWPLAEQLRREFDAVGFFLSGHPLDAYAAVLARLRVQRWTDFARAVKQGASAGRLAATVLDRHERRTKSGSKMGIVQLSDPSGQYEAILFQEGLNQYRDLLEKGAAVLLSLQANVEGEDVRARIVSVEPLDAAASRVQKGLRIFLRDENPLRHIAQRLAARGDGEVALILLTGAGEVEVKLPGKYMVSPQIAGALKAIPGIVAVEHV